MIQQLSNTDSFIPCKKLTIFYMDDGMTTVNIQEVQRYDFGLERSVILENFKKIEHKQRILDVASDEILGNGNNYEYKEIDGESFFIESSKNVNNTLKMTINSLSFGTVQAIGLATIILNPVVFGKNSMLMIFHPEIGLHPKSQSAVGKLIVKSYLDNQKIFQENCPQIFLETWSDHIINGMRVELLKKDSHPNVVINFMKNGYCESITLNETAKFSTYPKGFQDQYQKDMSALLGIRF